MEEEKRSLTLLLSQFQIITPLNLSEEIPCPKTESLVGIPVKRPAITDLVKLVPAIGIFIIVKKLMPQ